MKKIKRILMLLLCLAGGGLYAQPPGGFPGGGMPGGGMPGAKTQNIKNKFLDVAYANKSTAEKLDIYLPDESKGSFPVIVSIHGGAFMFGDKADGQLNPMLEGLKHGYAVISLNYRMSGEAKFPAPVQDVKAAIRFIRANAAKYHLNPNKIAVWGGSAGANLASMIGTTGDVDNFDDSGLGNASVSSKVQAVVDWFGSIQFDQMDAQFKETGNGQANHGAADSPESRMLGAAVATSPELVKKASPATYISKNDPPFFIEVGTKDQMVPTQQSQDFYKELVKVLGSDKVSITLLEGANHGGPQFETPENVAKVIAFLDKYLK